jgi:PAS domain S-box-containing protein
MKKFREYSINKKIVVILGSILFVNICCLIFLHFFEIGKTEMVKTVNSQSQDSFILQYGKKDNILAGFDPYTANQRIQKEAYFLNSDTQLNFNSEYLLLIFIFSSITSCGICYVAMKNYVVKPVKVILDTCDDLALGNIPVLTEYKSNDELGQIVNSINKVINNKTELVDFVEKIEKGETNADYKLLSEKDVIGSSLISMREKMLKISEEDAKRSWANEGVALFSEILMTDYSLNERSEKLLSGIVKYVSANQGAFFIKETDSNNETIFQMYACYAWNRKKFLEKQLRLNEGLVGQAAIEKETIFITEVPDDYIKITSGMGDSNPRSILIVPLKINDIVHGVLELASFRVFEEHEISFIENLAENIASSIANTKTNEQTKKLLEDTKIMNENLMAQEEELRQNTEELNATQESLERAKENMRIQILELQSEKIKNIEILEGCQDAIISFTENGVVDFFNRASEEMWHVEKKWAIGRTIKEFISLEIINSDNGKELYYLQNERKEKLDSRKEILININGTISSTLITISKVKTGEEYFFTAFIQSIAVELF